MLMCHTPKSSLIPHCMFKCSSRTGEVLRIVDRDLTQPAGVGDFTLHLLFLFILKEWNPHLDMIYHVAVTSYNHIYFCSQKWAYIINSSWNSAEFASESKQEDREVSTDSSPEDGLSPASWRFQQAHLLDSGDSRVTACLDKSQPWFATALCRSKTGLDRASLLEEMGAKGDLCGVPHTGVLWFLGAFIQQQAGYSLCFTMWTLLMTVGAPGPPELWQTVSTEHGHRLCPCFGSGRTKDFCVTRHWLMGLNYGLEITDLPYLPTNQASEASQNNPTENWPKLTNSSGTAPVKSSCLYPQANPDTFKAEVGSFLSHPPQPSECLKSSWTLLIPARDIWHFLQNFFFISISSSFPCNP